MSDEPTSPCCRCGAGIPTSWCRLTTSDGDVCRECVTDDDLRPLNEVADAITSNVTSDATSDVTSNVTSTDAAELREITSAYAQREGLSGEDVEIFADWVLCNVEQGTIGPLGEMFLVFVTSTLPALRRQVATMLCEIDEFLASAA